jgi:hypothetical protein
MRYEVRQEATYAERAQRLKAVREEYITFRKQVERELQLDYMDGRLVFLRNAQSFARSAIVFLHLFQRCGENPQLALNVFGLSSLDGVGRNLKTNSKFIRLSWCAQFNFQLENLFRNILQGLGEDAPRGYWQICRALLNTLQLDNREHYLDVLNIIAYIRNSQHANGTHFGYRQQDSVIEVEGAVFEFRHGEIVTCATWDHIAHAWLNILPILRQVYYHDEVLRIPGVLPSAFS